MPVLSPTPGTAYPQHYAAQFAHKAANFQQRFRAFDLPEPALFASPPSHYRMRAEFRVWQQGNEASYVMFNPQAPKEPITISDFSIGSRAINRLMAPLMREINACDTLRHYLFQVEFLSSSQGEIVTTLIYRKKLHENWLLRAQRLGEQLGTHIIGRSKGQKVVVGQDYVTEAFQVGGQTYRYQQIETAFSQPNHAVCEKMLNWAQGLSTPEDARGDLLELYCGNGNFTLPLSRNFRRTLATEVSKTSVNSARFNMQLNRVANIEIVRMSSEEFTEALSGRRTFRRLRHIDLEDYRFTSIFVDPPRSGLDKATEALCQTFDNIIYISCNPETAAANLDTLSQSHRVAQVALFDQFPYTHHLECGLFLQRR